MENAKRRERLRSRERNNPLDFELLTRLPKEGTRVGLRNVGKTVKGLTVEMRELDETVTAAQVNARLNRLARYDYVTRVVLSHTHEGWGHQINNNGLKLLRENGYKHVNGTKEEGASGSGN